MKSKLGFALLKMTDTDFRELQHAILIAAAARDFLADFGISEEDFSKEMKLNPAECRQWLCGAYPYDIMKISEFQMYRRTKEIEKVANKKHELLT